MDKERLGEVNEGESRSVYSASASASCASKTWSEEVSKRIQGTVWRLRRSDDGRRDARPRYLPCRPETWTLARLIRSKSEAADLHHPSLRHRKRLPARSSLPTHPPAPDQFGQQTTCDLRPAPCALRDFNCLCSTGPSITSSTQTAKEGIWRIRDSYWERGLRFAFSGVNLPRDLLAHQHVFD